MKAWYYLTECGKRLIAHCAMAFLLFYGPLWKGIAQTGKESEHIVGRASLSAPESLTRGHENTTSQVRVSGMEGDAKRATTEKGL